MILPDLLGGVNQNPNQEQYPRPCQTAKSYLSLKSQTEITSQKCFI